MMKLLKNIFILFLLSIELLSCSKKNFSQEFVRRYISDTNWLHQLSYSPSSMFSLQFGMREIKFDKTGSTYLIKRNSIVNSIISKLRESSYNISHSKITAGIIL